MFREFSVWEKSPFDKICKIWYNKLMKCDFHIHSICSDGIFTPQKIVEMAKEKGLDCISLTDHDTILGVKSAQQRAEELGLKCITGVEISTLASCGDVHILAYNLETDTPGFEEEMQKISDFRMQRNKLMQQRFDENGIDLDILSLKSDGSIGRGEIAREMVKRGICQSVAEAFDKYLGTDKCCYVKTRRLTPVEAIQFALRFGGIPVLAHPKNLRMNCAQFEKFLRPLVLAGLGGIEAQYFSHTNSERKFFGRMAKKYHLIITGGSDFHDYAHGLPLGQQSFSPSNYTKTILGI